MFDWLFGGSSWQRDYDSYDKSNGWSRSYPDGSTEGRNDSGSKYTERKYLDGNVWREYDDGRTVKVSDQD